MARRAGLSETELVTLEHLSREQIGPAEVARRLEVSTAAATGIVDRLVSRGHVERRPHEVDRRRTELDITDSGRGEIVGHLMPMFAALDRPRRVASPRRRRRSSSATCAARPTPSSRSLEPSPRAGG